MIDDQQLAAWLQRGSQSAPAGLLADLLEQVAAEPQRSGWRRPSSWAGALVPVGIAVASVVAIVVIGSGNGLFGGPVVPGGSTVSPEPSVVTSSSPVASPTPTATVPPFDRPFTYTLDPASGMTLDAFPNLYQFRTTDPADSDLRPTGVNVRAIPAIKTTDWCTPDGALKSSPTPADVIDAIRQMPGVEAGSTTHTSIDGRDALEMTFVVHPTTDCPDLYLYPGTVAFNGASSSDSVRRFALVDVNGETVLVASFADRGEAAAATFFPIADRFIDSLRFVSPVSTPSLSP
jgi:hypothetical protein